MTVSQGDEGGAEAAATQDGPAPYQVLARKYRPETFADLKGQDAMVRVLGNAFARDRIAHAFILTGVRGVGKTTTARIIAKGLNCVGPDGTGGPTVTPCGECAPCKAIAAGSHVDVLEMDAASRTGVGDIREIIDSVRYRAASARYKVYIIDEVHMLSTAAFNALLKTLEEPPAHVKFIFATTEIRKVPVTVLSRCQRFDLRRFEPEVMMAHLRWIAENEGAELTEAAFALITRAAEGSARDGLSLLDQAIAHGGGVAGAEEVRAMLGLADRGRVMDLFDCILRGEAGAALTELGAQYADGADPLAVLRDLAEVAHWVSLVKITPEAADDPTVSPDERNRGQALAQRAPMKVLSRMWQMLLRAIDEVGSAPNAMMAAEMAVIRLTHVSDLPSPEDLVRRLQDGPFGPQGGAGPGGGQGGDPGGTGARAQLRVVAGGMTTATGGAARVVATGALAHLQRFEDVLALLEAQGEFPLLVDIERGLRLVSYAPGRISFTPSNEAPSDLAQLLAAGLHRATENRWGISVVPDGRAPTIAERRRAEEDALVSTARAHPLVAAALGIFPGAELNLLPPEGMDADEIIPLEMLEEGWDPFEEED